MYSESLQIPLRQNPSGELADITYTHGPEEAAGSVTDTAIPLASAHMLDQMFAEADRVMQDMTNPERFLEQVRQTGGQ